MFTPTRDQSRQFLIEAWRKRRGNLPASALEILAADIAALHPEYHGLLESGEDALARDWMPDQGETNPFLHLSLHLAIEEQLSIDQPRGLRALFADLLTRRGDRHEALHVVLDCLAETIWRSQRERKPLDGPAYLDCVRQAARR